MQIAVSGLDFSFERCSICFLLLFASPEGRLNTDSGFFTALYQCVASHNHLSIMDTYVKIHYRDIYKIIIHEMCNQNIKDFKRIVP